MATSREIAKTTYFARTDSLVFNEVDADKAGLVLEVVGESGRIFITRAELSEISRILLQWAELLPDEHEGGK